MDSFQGNLIRTFGFITTPVPILAPNIFNKIHLSREIGSQPDSKISSETTYQATRIKGPLPVSKFPEL
jgi:hypothetical protein